MASRSSGATIIATLAATAGVLFLANAAATSAVHAGIGAPSAAARASRTALSESSERSHLARELAIGIPGAWPLHQGVPLSSHDEQPVERIVPGLLVVKYRHSVDDCVHCLLARGQMFSATIGTASLDRLNAELGVVSARSLFFERHDMSAASARAAFELHIEAVHARHPQRTRRIRPDATVPDLTHVYELELSRDVDIARAAERYAADPDVVYAEPVREIRVSYLPDDPFLSTSGSWGQGYEDLWGLFAINAPAAWDTASGEGQVIAVVDTGVDAAHADIAANLWSNLGEIPGNGLDDDANGFIDDVNGWNFDSDDNDLLDKHGHGTHVAAIAAGVGDDGYGVAGVAYDARIMALKGLSDQGSGFSTALSEAVVYAADNGADVVNNSWGGFSLGDNIYDAIAYADALGVVVVSASGNEGRAIDNLLWLPHGHPQGLTVGALDTDGTLAEFSNYGPFQSIAAPGVDVLSAKSDKEIFDKDFDVSGDWVRLSGTSMASPYVAGAAAVLLSGLPALTTTEVRWQLELNATQPPGFEGPLHNTTYGYGVLDAGAMFSPVPVTTRLQTPNQTVWHAFAEQRMTPGAPATVSFTTLAAEPWSVAAFASLAPITANGSGDAPIELEIDAAAMSPGTYQGEVVLSVPGAIDGGGSFASTVHVHADARDGAVTTVATEAYATVLGYSPQIGASHMASLAAWQGTESETTGLFVARIDGAGIATAPTFTGAAYVRSLQVASDGQDFLVAWRDSRFGDEGAHFVRVGADGALLDTVPVRAYTRRQKSGCGKYVEVFGAAFDGEDYWIAYNDLKLCGRPKSIVYLVRVHRDGSVARPVRALKIKRDILPIFGCRGSDCMLAWWDTVVEGSDAFGKFIRSAWAMPIAQGEALGEPVKIVTDLFGLFEIASDGQDYMAIGQRSHFCAIGDLCRNEVIGVRIDGNTGAPIDGDALVLSNAPPLERYYAWPGGITHDGSDYIASYQSIAVDDSPFADGSYVFVNRIGDDGIPQSTEVMGTLVESSGRSSESRIAASQLGSVVFYENGEFDPLVGIYPHPDFSDHMAQRMYARTPDASVFPEVEIGSIGTRVLDERASVRFRVVASGLAPGSTIYSASGLPPGAVFDADSGLFQWSPDGTAAGSYVGANFSATDGSNNVAESVTFEVTEAVATATGLVRLADGTPVGGVALAIKGTADRLRAAYTKADGSFSVEELVPGKKVKIRLGKASKKAYRLAPKKAAFVSGAGDVVVPDLVATPR